MLAVALALALAGLSVDASAFVRVGGGLGVMGNEFVPLARLILDVPLWFLTISLDTEFWLHPGGQRWLLPFVVVSAPLILQTSLGLAPFIALSAQGVSLATSGVVLKGGIGTALGPLGLFGEALFWIVPSGEVPGIPEPGRPVFAVGLILGF